VETKPGGFESLSDADWQAIIDLNLVGPARLDRAFVPGMIERGSGVVIHIGSVSARLPLAANSTLVYAAAKAGLATYSKGLAKAVAPHGVRVTMISPGFIETSGAQGMIADIVRNTGASEAAARQQIVDMLGGIPVGRPGRPEEVANWSLSWRPTAPPSSAAPTMCWTAGPSQPSDRHPAGLENHQEGQRLQGIGRLLRRNYEVLGRRSVFRTGSNCRIAMGQRGRSLLWVGGVETLERTRHIETSFSRLRRTR
jgi:short chain dehydrogenase